MGSWAQGSKERKARSGYQGGLTSQRLITLVITQQVPRTAVRRGRKGGNGEEIEEKWRARSARVSLRKKKIKMKTLKVRASQSTSSQKH